MELDRADPGGPRRAGFDEERSRILLVDNPLVLVCLALAAAGAATLLAQVVLLREILASAHGNELVLGGALAAWLSLSALSSLLGARWAGSPAQARRRLGTLLCLAPTLLLASLWLTRFVGGASSMAGEEAGLFGPLAASWVALLPACLVAGMSFGFAARAVPERGSKGVTSIYIAELVGACLGGLVFHFTLADYLPSAWTILVAGAVSAAAGAALRWPGKSFHPALAAALVLGAGGLFASRLGTSLDAARFAGEHVLFASSSRYGRLAVLARGEQRAFFHDGVLLFTTEDDASAEERVHLPMLLHPHPSRILLVGGGVGGGLTEVLKHQPDVIDYVEMDPAIVATARMYADRKTQAALADPRVHVITGDGRTLLRQGAGSYDVILLDLPVPQNALLARFSSVECLREARHALAPGGVLALVSPGAETHLDRAAAMRHAAILATLERVFPAVGVAPGVQTLFWASADKVDANPSLLVERFKQRNLQSLTMQVGRAWLLDRLQSMNLAEYRRDLLSASFVASWDFRPVTYLYGLVENAERVSPAFGRVALSFAKAVWAPSSVLALVLGLAVVVLVVRHGRGAPGFAAGAAGAAGMALQLVLLLAFQSLRGHLYHALGGLLAGFMGGMAVGAWLGQHLVHRRRALAAMCAVASALAATISPLLHLAQKVPSLSVTLLLVLLSGIGLATGAIFPLAVHGASGPEGGRATSIYAWDLAGAAGAAVLGSLVAIPLLGFEAVAWTSCALYATAALANGRARR